MGPEDEAQAERQREIYALMDKIVDAACCIDDNCAPKDLYDLARRHEIKGKLIKTFDCLLQLTDDLESMDVLWHVVANYGTEDQETLDGLVEEAIASCFSPDDLHAEIIAFRARELWLRDDAAVTNFIRDYSYNLDIVCEAAAEESVTKPLKSPS
jgi:hypothetical protein